MEDEKLREVLINLNLALQAITKAFDIAPTSQGTYFTLPEIIGDAIMTAGKDIANAIRESNDYDNDHIVKP